MEVTVQRLCRLKLFNTGFKLVVTPNITKKNIHFKVVNVQHKICKREVSPRDIQPTQTTKLVSRYSVRIVIQDYECGLRTQEDTPNCVCRPGTKNAHYVETASKSVLDGPNRFFQFNYNITKATLSHYDIQNQL